MGISDLLKNIFGRREADSVSVVKPPVSEKITSTDKFVQLSADAGQSNLTLSGSDLMKMSKKLVGKGEYSRAELLIRDGVREMVDNLDIWLLLLIIEESLGRSGRAYYCLEQILDHDPGNEELLEKAEKLKEVIDKHLNQFIEYKLAPEFFKLK